MAKFFGYVRWAAIIAARLAYLALVILAKLAMVLAIFVMAIVLLMEQQPEPVEFGEAQAEPAEQFESQDYWDYSTWSIEVDEPVKTAAKAMQSDQVLVVPVSDYASMGIRQLRDEARGKIPGFMRLKKAELIARLSAIE